MKTIRTQKNLESAFAGESMAYQKYLYFAKLARKKGFEEVALAFEDTAKHEIGHAEGHLRFLYPEESLSVEDILKIAIAGETYEYTEMYPSFEKTAQEENQSMAVEEFQEQAQESKEHAEFFKKNLAKISKVFAGLAKVEQAHAKKYEEQLAKLKNY
ncbi:MAG: rubrerythrin family protein [Bacteriovorax sp.]|jgi:rubrerythrin